MILFQSLLMLDLGIDPAADRVEKLDASGSRAVRSSIACVKSRSVNVYTNYIQRFVLFAHAPPLSLALCVTKNTKIMTWAQLLTALRRHGRDLQLCCCVGPYDK